MGPGIIHAESGEVSGMMISKQSGSGQVIPNTCPPAKFLSHCSATAQIVGGANMHDYDGHEYHYEHIAHAYAYDFSHADADEWDCFLSNVLFKTQCFSFGM